MNISNIVTLFQIQPNYGEIEFEILSVIPDICATTFISFKSVRARYFNPWLFVTDDFFQHIPGN